MKDLNQKLAVIQTELKAKKSSYNSFGKYYFRKAEDILEAVKPFLLREKVSVRGIFKGIWYRRTSNYSNGINIWNK